MPTFEEEIMARIFSSSGGTNLLILVRYIKVVEYDLDCLLGVYCGDMIFTNRSNKEENCVSLYVHLGNQENIFTTSIICRRFIS